MRFVASGSGSELILFDLRLLKPEEASSVKSNRGLLVLEALLPLPNFEWKTEEVTQFQSFKGNKLVDSYYFGWRYRNEPRPQVPVPHVQEVL